METHNFDVEAKYYHLRLSLQIVSGDDNTTTLQIEFIDDELRLNYQELSDILFQFVEIHYPGQIWTLQCSVSEDEKDENFECIPRTRLISPNDSIEKFWMIFYSNLDVASLQRMVRIVLASTFSLIIDTKGKTS